MRQVEELTTSIDPGDLRKVAYTYADVFAGEPWNEVSRCSSCGGFGSSKPAEAKECECGKGVLNKEAYPTKETAAYIQAEISKPNAVALYTIQMEMIRIVTEAIKGFAWGYEQTASGLSVAKYKRPEMQETVQDILQSLILSGMFFYISEVGVLPEYQGQGKGKRLVDQMITEAKWKGATDFVMRTNEDSPMRYIAENIGMKPVIGLDTGVRDEENIARVLYIGKR